MTPTRSVALVFILSTAITTSTAQPAAGSLSADEIEVVSTEPIHAVVLPMKGSYTQHPAAFERLGAFLSARGARPSGPGFGCYFSDPAVGEANLEWEVGFPAPADLTVEAPFEVREVPGTLAAVHVHRGPIEELGTAWSDLVQWVIANGYQPAGPACQVFPEGLSSGVVELRLPVHKP
jgi:effector-binding domain-containing protein